MIELEKVTFQTFLYKAVEFAKKENRCRLLSWTEKIARIDMLAIFQAAKNTAKDRTFWSNHRRNYTFVGIGHVKKLIAEKDRYIDLKRKWNDVIECSIIHNPDNMPGTGLVSIGGMTFDSKRERSELWSSYPPSQLKVPEYSFVQKDDTYFMTINKVVDKETNIGEVLQEVDEMKNILFSSEPLRGERAQKIVEQNELHVDEWLNSVKKAIDSIKQDKVKKIVLARELQLRLNKEANITEMLKKLQNNQPTSYIFAVEENGECFLGATPERLVQVEGDELLSTCLAGTAPRGKTEEEDTQIKEDLFADGKNRKEHHYVVEMIRQAIEPYCTNIDIPEEPQTYALRDLYHLYTPVRATLKNDYTVFELIEQLHPTPALGGEPKEVALRFIREEERLDRGWYGAPIGWIDAAWNSEFAVAIRSGLVKGKEVSLFAGCGIMGDSNPQMEYEETKIKFLPMLTVLEDE